MTYDLFDYFQKYITNPVLPGATEIVRQNIWRESINVVQSQQWIETVDKIRIDLYVALRYT